MRFFILMPLIPGLILWAVVTAMNSMANKGRQIQAEKDAEKERILTNKNERSLAHYRMVE